MRLPASPVTRPVSARALLVLVTGWLLSLNAAALSLGEITVNSALGERFFAVVPIDDVRRSDADKILVTLAPRSVYQRMGVEFEYFHTGLVFDVLRDERNAVYLRIVSEDVLFEPYMDFVISVRWPSGFLSEQFTVLLDLPAASAVPVRQAVPVTPPVSSEPGAGSIDREPAVSAPVAETAPVVTTPVEVEAPVITQSAAPRVVPRPQPVREPEPVPVPVAEVEPEIIEQPVAEVEVAEPEVAPAETADAEIAETATTEPAVTESGSGETGIIEDEAVGAEALVAETIEAEAESTADIVVEESVAEVVVDESESVVEDAATAEEVVDIAEEVAAVEPEPALEETPLAEEEPVVAESSVAQEPAQPKVISRPAPPPEPLVQPAPVVEPEPAAEAPAPVVAAQPEIPEAPTEPELQATEQQANWQMTSQRGDTLWGLARKIQKQSGGRIVDIVRALHENNASAFIRGDANKLRVDADLAVSQAQIRAATPLAYRDSLNASLLPSTLASEQPAEQPQVEAGADTSETASGAVQQPAGEDGVLSLVAGDSSADSGQVSQLTESLSEQSEQATGSLNEQVDRSSARTDAIESRMDNLMSQYQVLSERTDQLKELEQELNRSIADKAQVEMGLAEADLPVQQEQLEEAREAALEEGAADTEGTSWLQWLMLAIGVLVMLVAVYWVTTLLKARRFQQHSDWMDQDWDNEIFGEGDDGRPSDAELSELVKLKGEQALLDQREAIDNGATASEVVVDEQSEGAAELQASLYIAYERFDEAEQLIKDELGRSPDNAALKAQLLEVYAATGQTDAFEALAEELQESSGENLQGKITALRG